MNKFESASILAGISPNEEAQALAPTNLHVITGEVVGKSENGKTLVAMDGMVFTGDDSQYVEIDTLGGLEEGDAATILLSGESGQAMTPLAIGSVGSVDRIAKSASDAYDMASSAQGIAQEAKEVAEATGQHVWPDSDGVHVTEVTQDEWNDSTGTSYHSGANVLLNALGQLFRDGLNNILAIVSGTDPGVAIYDGEGNTADNIMALFSKALIRIGGRLLGTGTSTASVQFFQSDASQTDVTATHTVGSTARPTGPDDVYGVNHGVQVTTSTDDSELGEGAEGHVAWAALDLFADVNPDYEAGHAMLKATTGDTPYDSSTDPTLGVLRQVADNGTEGSRIYGSAAEIQLNDTARYKTGVVTVEQAINELTESSGTGTYTSPFSAYSGLNGNLPRWWRSGNVVHFSGIATVTSQQADATRTLFTLPAGFRPNGRNRYLGRMQGSGMNSWELSVETSGEVKLQRYGTTSAIALPSGVWLPYAGTFII